MNNLEKITYYNELYDLYKNLLTSKQRMYFEMYYFDDLSLKEIADNFNVSRNAVHLNITKTIKHLIEFEDQLNIHHKIEKINQLLNNNIDNKLLKNVIIDKIITILKDE
ncbi:MAG: DNA-binding protein [Bacilli bacterium]|jgi:predicted DNA-binding protein YlxM (UPF0122 family)|nr:DNA-binding protein [Bacilli bacterium]